MSGEIEFTVGGESLVHNITSTITSAVQERMIPPLVSTGWLFDNLNNHELVILDIRSSEDYSNGHIPPAVNVPFQQWITTRNELLLEVPDKKTLFNIIGSSGINTNSAVIIVNKADNPFCLADAARVADTLIYAGIKNAAILNGGYDRWTTEKKRSSTAACSPAAKKYEGETRETMFATEDYIHKKSGKSLLLDAREPDVYFGLIKEPYASRPGHIPTAKNLPAPWIWEEGGIYRSSEKLGQMAAGITGKNKSKEIIIYCGVGGYTAAWWFVLTQVLGYTNVKIYDGSAQEWTRNPENPVTVYKWE